MPRKGPSSPPSFPSALALGRCPQLAPTPGGSLIPLRGKALPSEEWPNPAAGKARARTSKSSPVTGLAPPRPGPLSSCSPVGWTPPARTCSAGRFTALDGRRGPTRRGGCGRGLNALGLAGSLAPARPGWGRERAPASLGRLAPGPLGRPVFRKTGPVSRPHRRHLGPARYGPPTVPSRPRYVPGFYPFSALILPG